MKLYCAGLLLIQNKKLLLAFSKNKQCYYLPGGKLDAEETEIEALCREVAEELNISVTPPDLEFYTHITAPAYGEIDGTIMEQDCFFLHHSVSPNPSAEIGEIKYFSLNDYQKENNQAPGAVMVLQQLKVDGYID